MFGLFKSRLSEDVAAGLMLKEDAAFAESKAKEWTDALMKLVAGHHHVRNQANENFTPERIRQTLFCCVAANSLVAWQALRRRRQAKSDIAIWYLDLVKKQLDGRYLARLIHEMIGYNYSAYDELRIMPFDSFIRISLRELGFDEIAKDRRTASLDGFDTMRYLFDSKVADNLIDRYWITAGKIRRSRYGALRFD